MCYKMLHWVQTVKGAKENLYIQKHWVQGTSLLRSRFGFKLP